MIRFAWEGRSWITRPGYRTKYAYIGEKSIPLERRPAIVIAERWIIPLGRWNAA